MDIIDAWISKIFKNLIENKIYQKIAVSKEALRTASEYIPGKFEIIPNAIDHSHFSKLDNITKFNFGKQKKTFKHYWECRDSWITTI